MYSSKKISNQWDFGSKFQIGDDHDTDLAHTLTAVAAINVRDFAEALNLLHGDERFVFRGACYQNLNQLPEVPNTNLPNRAIALNYPNSSNRIAKRSSYCASRAAVEANKTRQYWGKGLRMIKD